MSLFNLFKKKTQVEEIIPNQIPEKVVSTAELKKHFEEYKKNIPSILLKFKSTMNFDSFNFDYDEINHVEEFYLKHTKNSGDLNYSRNEFDLAYDTYIAHAFIWNVGGEIDVFLEKNAQQSGKICLTNVGGKDGLIVTRPIDGFHRISLDHENKEKMGDFLFKLIEVYSTFPEFEIKPNRNFNI